MYYRFVRSADVAACISLIHPGFQASARVREAMPALWRRLLVAGQLHGGAMVDASEARSVLGFGVSVFVDDAFIEDYLCAPQPYLSALVYERMLADRSPVLTRDALRRGNTEGVLNLLVLHFGMRESDPPTPRDLEIVEKGRLGFRLAHDGYRVSRVIQEVYGSLGLAYMKAGGFRLACDFATYYAARGGSEPGQATHPYLMAIARGDPESRLPGSAVSYMFQHFVPRFAFTPAEQRVLFRTLMDETDEKVSDHLGVSRDAVKKVWRRIYQRVAAVDPELLEENEQSGDPDLMVHGRERRLRLIRYLRYHLEELRPFKHTARAPFASRSTG